ncbi:hypothetical protein [Myxococcus xanthus]|uniref:hypothetical protein n=1 Tax=Myxococcus xanthus TaxID=34 RepID=UPI0011276A12|nr:hypothetical protein [Myxococcus xanthus]
MSDKSRLNSKRIQVVWLSPNHWNDGFRYGNIRFDFDLTSLLKNKRFYWVESVAYGVPACRILITDQNRDGELTPYDPSKRQGPWWHDQSSDQHYYNGKYCLEFMLEDELPISSCTSVSFVQHHKYQCCISPSSCPDRGQGAQDSSARFLAGVAGRLLPTKADLLLPQFDLPFERFTIRGAWTLMKDAVSDCAPLSGPLDVVDDTAVAVARAALRAIGDRSTPEAHRLIRLFHSKERALDAMQLVLLRAFKSMDEKDFS